MSTQWPWGSPQERGWQCAFIMVAPDSKMPPNGAVMQIRCQCILHGCGMTKSINLIAPAFATMSAAISAVKPNKITSMCLMLMPNDAATSPPNAKTIRRRIAGFDSATSLPRMLFANHSVPSCWQVFGLRWVVECGGACGAVHRTGPTVKPPRTTSCMTPTHHHNR